jgi:hypothetical protein
MNPIHIPKPYFPKIHLNVVLPSLCGKGLQIEGLVKEVEILSPFIIRRFDGPYKEEEFEENITLFDYFFYT